MAAPTISAPLMLPPAMPSAILPFTVVSMLEADASV